MQKPTGCPQCGGDDYDSEPDPETGLPEYEGGEKTCEACGEVWI